MSRRGSILQDYGNINHTQTMEAQHNAAQYYQRDKELNAQMGQRKQEQTDADKYRKLKMIDDATDPSTYQSSTQKANSLATEQLLSVRNEFAGKTNLPPDQLYLELQKKLTPVSQGYNSYKADLTEQEALAKKAVEVNPNLDMQKILVDLQKQVDSHHLITKPDGGIDFNQATIGTNSNALQEILKPENAWKYSKGTKSLIDFVKKGGEKGELFSQSPDGTQINYTTNIPEWAQLVDEKGNPLEVDPKTGLIPKGKQPKVALKGTKQDYEEIDENGRPVTKTMIVVSQPTMNKILSNDELEYAFEGDWQKHKQFSKLDVSPEHEQDLKRVYFSQWLNDNGLSQPYVSSRTHLPPQPRVSIKVNNGKGGDDTVIRDVFNEINDKASTSREGYGFPLNSLSATAQGVVLKYANELTGGDLTQADIYVRKEPNGTISIVRAEDNKLIAPMDFADVNMKVQPGVKEKRKVIEQVYSNITETNKGQIGLKNGKWYDIKTGKPIE